jgi:hypothetical protein
MIMPKNGVSAAGAVAKLIVDPAIENSTPGFCGSPLSTTIIANAVGGVNAVPPTVIGKLVVDPSKVKLSIFLY